MHDSDSTRKRPRRSKSDPAQLILPLAGHTPPEVIALRSIAWESTGMPRDLWRQCRELAIAIAFCGMRDGCRASVGKLIEVANQNAPPGEPVIGSKATFHRALQRLVALGLVVCEPQSSKRGNAAALRRLVPERLDKLVAASRKLTRANREFPEENEFRETHLRLTVLITQPL